MPAKPGQRKEQILQTLAEMLQSPEPEKITTAALAARLDLSEAALYRHFASKAQMFEGLIEFIESTLFGLINKILAEEERGVVQLDAILTLCLGFAAKNPGMSRVLIGDALVHENERLQARINQLVDRIEATLRQCLRVAATQGEIQGDSDANAVANLMIAFILGRWHQFAKSGFKRAPLDHFDAQKRFLLSALRPYPVTVGVNTLAQGR
ncbi:nucleoid occlusion factor SlmA [Thiobacter aerophilum]|uniref:Nucleoid occlusion factor SlmA n=1 Tax=Thiobacter aerophilum TaxID=3121275 RepID=A0ABV0EE08_9BURK